MSKKNQPHNPGLSQKAWERLHRFVAKMNLKYASKLAQKEEKGTSSESA